MEIQELIDFFISSAEFQGLSPNSKRTYTHYLKKLKEQLSGNVIFDRNQKENTFRGEASAPQLNAVPVRVAMQNDVALLFGVVSTFQGPQGQRMARRVFIRLFSFAEEYGLCQSNLSNKIPLPKLTAKPRTPFTVAEVNLLAQSAGRGLFSAKHTPYIMEAVVAFHTGMRPSELDSLTWSDVGEDFIKVRSTKGHEVGAVARMVKLTPSVASCVNKRSTGLVFKSVSGKKLNKDTRSEAIHQACKTVGIQPREFYNTRRGTATEMYKAGYNIVAIQHQLGHADISTTQIYIKPSMQEAASVFRGF